MELYQKAEKKQSLFNIPAREGKKILTLQKDSAINIKQCI